MGQHDLWGRTRLALCLAAGLVAALVGACAAPPADTSSRQLAELQQRLAAQETRVAGLQSQNAALQTAVARLSLAPTPTAVALPPPVPGLAVSGATKGSPEAKVTLVEYKDFL